MAFLDSDDEWLPGKLQAQVAELERRPEAPLCHSDEIWIRNGRRVNPRTIHRKEGGWIFHRSLDLCCISPSSVLLQRELFQEVGLFDESLPACEDYDLWLRVTSRYPVAFVEERLLVKHGGHEDQLSRTVPALDRYRIRALVSLLEAGSLSPEFRAATVKALARRIEIYARGCWKRGRQEEAESLQALRKRWLTRLP